jgi:hypothetical protein
MEWIWECFSGRVIVSQAHLTLERNLIPRESINEVENYLPRAVFETQ